MLVQINRIGDVALLTLNHPEKRNCLSRALVSAFLDALDLPTVRSARALIIEACGPAFCAGADITDLANGDWMGKQDFASSPVTLFHSLADDSRPVIAAVQGPALGGGFELVLSCDLAVACDAAYFALPEAGYGVIPNTGLALLAPIVGRRRALGLMFTRRRVDAEEAFALGLVNAVVSADAIRDKAIDLAKSIVDGASPGAIREIKRSLNTHAGVDWVEVSASLSRLPRAEWQEGLRAFIERRVPNYDMFWRDS